ncbi:hypothetical protein INS49_014635 [Diaporthe citri]|uniref:uncharacterized protein n=1 Tax=Diaporthe citri TaxID=83186 RepID=UPI001C805FD2|nr:uncharacterized protein INS49_014635 [Diaporthe citri]KAG6356761.1 hypothetical protein INS49_014635 [Diaporthe citri]
MNGLPSLGEKFKIIDLPIYPSEFANREVINALRSRGRMFWECRTRKYVSYMNTDAADGTQDIADSRYMIDIATYKQMHRNKEPERFVARDGAETEDELASEHMACDNPKLGDDFFMCLPPAIPGFNMQKKEWMVLLDEADVFLEQRSLVNLERNALVSVFLRVLEYYDGALILTSNRMGTFDDAFKSRIQLNLRYKSLDENQRLQIWKNFLERLEGLEKNRLGGDAYSCGIDMKEIKGEVEVLAKAELNGRQIRNAISTARKLATYKREPLGASCYGTR